MTEQEKPLAPPIRELSPTMRRAREGLIIGLALTAALAGVQYIAYAGFRIPLVPFTVAEVLRDVFPGGVKTAGIEALGYAAKTLLVGGSALLFILYGGLLGALYGAVRPHLPGPDLLRGALIGLLGFLLIVPLEVVRNWVPASLIAGPLGLLVLFILWGLALDQSIRGALARPALPAGVSSPVMSRRTFLLQTGAGGALVGLLSLVIARLTDTSLFSPLRGGGGVPALTPTPNAEGFLPARGTWPEVTPNSRFYEVDIGIGAPPALDAASWRLAIGGSVEKAASYSLSDLLGKFKPVAPFYGTLMCISNTIGGNLNSTALWEGWRLADLLKAAGVNPGAVDVVFHCADGYSDSLPVKVALDPDTYLVYRMNGVPLPQSHGYPLRVYIPTRYGEKNAKWITAIELVNYDYKGYWQQEGWTDDATIKHSATVNTLDFQDHVSMIDAATAEIGGVANGGGRGISKVEFQINDGAWQPASLKQPLSAFTWRLWKAQFPVDPNQPRYKLSVRATDGQGHAQITQVAPPHPDGASGLDTRDIFPIQDAPPPSTPSVTPPTTPTSSAPTAAATKGAG